MFRLFLLSGVFRAGSASPPFLLLFPLIRLAWRSFDFGYLKMNRLLPKRARSGRLNRKSPRPEHLPSRVEILDCSRIHKKRGADKAGFQQGRCGLAPDDRLSSDV